MEFKPNKLSFLFNGFGIKLFLISIPLLLIHNIGVLLIIVSFIFIAYDLGRYKKEKYIIQDDKIIRYYGDWFSDNSIEILYKKVVEIKLTLPFISHLLFKTGVISISTAGGGYIALLSLDKPNEIYKKIFLKMNQAGYNLGSGDLVIKTKPSILGVVGEVVSGFINIRMIYFLIYAYITLNALYATGAMRFLNTFVWIALFVVILFIGIKFFITYMDLSKRSYNLYTDRIEYYEGFLTKHHSIIPIEVVSDIENRQGFFARIFGIHDIVVSAKGATNNIVFSNILNGEKFIESVKYIKEKINVNTVKTEGSSNEKTNDNLIKHENKIEKIINYNKTYTAEFKMSMKKVIIGNLLFFPILPIVIFRALFTKYKVNSSSFEYTFDFLSKKHTTFNVENITKVVFYRDLVDRILGTGTIKFYSIGASSSLRFSNIKITEDIKKNILTKVGIFKEETLKELKPDFNLKNFIFAKIFVLFLLFIFSVYLGILLNEHLKLSSLSLIIIIGVIYILGFISLYVYNIYLYKDKFYNAKVTKNYVSIKKGIINEKHSFALIHNITGINSIKLPFTSTGFLSFNVAGETIMTSNYGNNIISDFITFDYVDKVFLYHDAFDKLFNGNNLDKTEVLATKPDLKNTVIPLTLLGIFTIILGLGVIILIFILPYTIWSLKVTYYKLEKDRVVKGWGIIYKSKQTILNKKLDTVKMDKGFLNKIFGNGNIELYTLGSTTVNMNIKTVKDYQHIYEILKEKVE